MEFLSAFGLAEGHWMILFITALTIGMSKTGVFGLGSIMFPVMAAVFGGKVSSGIVLPMLIMADLFAVTYYRRHAEWGYLAKLIPWSALGIILGTIVGKGIDDRMFKITMGVIIVASVAIMIWRDYRRSTEIPDYWWFSMLMGVAGGFTTMVGNLAGPVAALYLLSMQLPKKSFIGTSAWFFLFVNVIKIPFHVFSWHTISLESFQLNLLMFPVITIGALLGIKITGYLSESIYRRSVIGLTLLSAGLLFW